MLAFYSEKVINSNYFFDSYINCLQVSNVLGEYTFISLTKVVAENKMPSSIKSLFLNRLA